MRNISTTVRGFIASPHRQITVAQKPSKVEALRRLPLPPVKDFDASDLPDGNVKDFFLAGKVPLAPDARAEIARFCLKKRLSLAMAWLFLRLEELEPAKWQSLQLAHIDEVPGKPRLKGSDAQFLAKWLAKWIGLLPLLNSVDLSNNSIGDDGAKALARILAKNLPLQHLKVASCEMTKKGTRRILDAQLQNTELRSLDVSSNACDYAGISALSAVLARNDCPLRSLDFSRVKQPKQTGEDFTNSLAKGLKQNQTLQHFGFAYMKHTRGMCDAIYQHKALRSIGLSGTSMKTKTVRALIQKPLLERIDLSDSQLPKEDMPTILRELQQSQRIEHVDLSCNYLDSHGQCIADMLRHSKTLRSLNLQSCSMSSKDVALIKKAAHASCSLQALDLSMQRTAFIREKPDPELDRHLLLNKRPQPAQLNNASNALHMLVSQENSHHVPLDLTTSIAHFLGAMGAEGVYALDNLTATAGRLPSIDWTE